MFQVFPTFLDESRKTFARLERFATNTHPLIHELRPAIRELRPTLKAVKRVRARPARRFVKLDPLITASKTGLPALRDTLNATTPLLGQVQPFLEQLNPILQYLEYYQWQTADFISNGAGAEADTVATANPTRWATTCASGARSARRPRRSGPTALRPTAATPTCRRSGRARVRQADDLPRARLRQRRRRRRHKHQPAAATAAGSRARSARAEAPAPRARRTPPRAGGTDPSCWSPPKAPAGQQRAGPARRRGELLEVVSRVAERRCR